MRNIFMLFALLVSFTQVGVSQTYKYLSMEDGLSSQKVHRILKDTLGYMWFLTQEGADRYDGKEIKHYELTDKGRKLNMQFNLNWLFLSADGSLWSVGRKGRIFRYLQEKDRFEQAYMPPLPEKGNTSPNVTYSYMDHSGCIWLCSKEQIGLFDTRTGKTTLLSNSMDGTVAAIEQIDTSHFFIGTEAGLYHAVLDKGNSSLTCTPAYDLHMPVSELFFSASRRKLFVGTFKQGIWVCDLDTSLETCSDETLNDVNVRRIIPFGENEVLIATDGKGVYRMNMDSCHTAPYIVTDYTIHNGMNGDNINDVYVDGDGRIWIANDPSGVTVRDNRYGGGKGR